MKIAAKARDQAKLWTVKINAEFENIIWFGKATLLTVPFPGALENRKLTYIEVHIIIFP